MKMLPASFCLLTVAAALCTASPLQSVDAHPKHGVARRDTWQVDQNSQWQIVLQNRLHIDADKPSITPDVDVYDIDMWLHKDTDVISSLHSLNKTVICYFSAGTYEPWAGDKDSFTGVIMGNKLAAWPDERWLDTRTDAVRKIMAARIATAANMGCDAIDTDNMDAYDVDNGLGLTQDDAVNYVQFLQGKASEASLGMGLKNALEILPKVQNIVQFAVNEQCSGYAECCKYQSFLDLGKPVFHIEYQGDASRYFPNNARCTNSSSSDSDSDSTSSSTSDSDSDSNSTSDLDSGSDTSSNTDQDESSTTKRDEDSTTITTLEGLLENDCNVWMTMLGFNSVIKELQLAGAVTYCDGNSYTTATD